MGTPKYLRGSTEQCPKCGSRKVGFDPTLEHKGYGPGIAACSNCKTIWEPFAPDDIWDKSDPHCSFKVPCNNCAFRRGSPEQSDPEEWAKIMENVEYFGGFYCHKGVPISADAKHGFAYPHKTVTVTASDETTLVEVPDTARLRSCRGYLNAAFSKKNMARLEAESTPTSAGGRETP